jgi:5-methyltetrahydropteroyltriglutamate--homocysteine methyltransferase
MSETPATPSLADDAGAPKPAFRADHVGSLLRPARLVEARRQAQAGTLAADALRAIEDSCVREAVLHQEAAGLYAVTDGDFRRESFHKDFLTRIDGIAWQPAPAAFRFGGGGALGESPLVFATTGKIRHREAIAVADFAALQAMTGRTAKVTLPAPSFAHCRGGRAAIDPIAYPDLDEFFADLGHAYAQEIDALGQAGCRYVQLDEVHYTFFCDPKLVATFEARGDDPADLAVTYAALINRSVAGRRPDMTIGVHLCRGNRRGSWVAEGGYEPVAELLFNTIDADRFLLEYDTDRAGGFEPLRFVPKGKTIVLGLISSKTEQMETADQLKRRIEEAARFVPIDQLALGPQCGFSSSIGGNPISPEAQWAKLALSARVAEEIWGSAA